MPTESSSPPKPPPSTRPHMPGYGIQPTHEGVGLLPWSFLSERMAHSRNYWVSTASPHSRPHAAPVWGVWHQERFYFSTGATSRKGRNLHANPHIVVHLESGDEAIILEGEVEELPAGELFDQVDAAYHHKYQVHLTTQDPVFALRPRVAYAWREHDFPGSATRWQFQPSPD